MSTTAEAEAAPFDPREVVTDQTVDMYALNRYVVRGHAARLAAIDERVRQDYPEALGVAALAAGEEARARMRAGLAEDVKGEAEAAVQGFRDRQALIADALKAVAPGGGNLDHARVQTLSSDLSNRLQNPPPSPEVGIDDRLAVIHSDWQRASLTGDAELAEATRIVATPILEGLKRKTALSPGSGDGQLSRSLSSAFHEHSGADLSHALLAAHADLERLGLQMAGMIDNMQVLATGGTPSGVQEAWSAGLTGTAARQPGIITPSGLGLARGGGNR